MSEWLRAALMSLAGQGVPIRVRNRWRRHGDTPAVGAPEVVDLPETYTSGHVFDLEQSANYLVLRDSRGGFATAVLGSDAAVNEGGPVIAVLANTKRTAAQEKTVALLTKLLSPEEFRDAPAPQESEEQEQKQEQEEQESEEQDAPVLGVVFPLGEGHYGTRDDEGATNGYNGGKDDIIRMQDQLLSLGYDTNTTGNYTKQTASAVAAFQKDRGLEETGVVDTGTWAAMFA